MKRRDIEKQLPRLANLRSPGQSRAFEQAHPAWLMVLRDGLRHSPYCLEAVSGDKNAGHLAFGPSPRVSCLADFWISLPYLNHGGVFGGRTTPTAA